MYSTWWGNKRNRWNFSILNRLTYLNVIFQGKISLGTPHKRVSTKTYHKHSHLALKLSWQQPGMNFFSTVWIHHYIFSKIRGWYCARIRPCWIQRLTWARMVARPVVENRQWGKTRGEKGHTYIRTQLKPAFSLGGILKIASMTQRWPCFARMWCLDDKKTKMTIDVVWWKEVRNKAQWLAKRRQLHTNQGDNLFHRRCWFRNMCNWAE